MSVQSDEFLHTHALKRPNGLTNASHPSSHLSRRIDIVGLLVDREALLGEQIELDHGGRERLGVHTQARYDAQHGPVERAVDLLERDLARVVDVDERHVAQEAVRERLAARVRGRVARAHELDALEAHPGLVGRAVEAVVLDALADEGDDALRAVLVLVGKVYLVAEDHQPFALNEGI